MTPADEVEVAAAHWLGRGASPKESVFALRLSFHDLRAVKVRIEVTTGNTGVARVDGRHRDLVASPDAYVSMATTLLAARSTGADSIREIPARAIVSQLERFMLLDDKHIEVETKRRAQQRLDAWRQRQARRQ